MEYINIKVFVSRSEHINGGFFILAKESLIVKQWRNFIECYIKNCGVTLIVNEMNIRNMTAYRPPRDFFQKKFKSSTSGLI